MKFEVRHPLTGKVVMTAKQQTTPYSAEIMLGMLAAGYTIRVDGKKLSKAEVKSLKQKEGGTV